MTSILNFLRQLPEAIFTTRSRACVTNRNSFPAKAWDPSAIKPSGILSGTTTKTVSHPRLGRYDPVIVVLADTDLILFPRHRRAGDPWQRLFRNSILCDRQRRRKIHRRQRDHHPAKCAPVFLEFLWFSSPCTTLAWAPPSKCLMALLPSSPPY